MFSSTSHFGLGDPISDRLQGRRQVQSTVGNGTGNAKAIFVGTVATYPMQAKQPLGLHLCKVVLHPSSSFPVMRKQTAR